MRRGPAPRNGSKARLVVAFIMAAFALVSYFGSREYNPVTGETQYISLTPHQEIAMGLQAAPRMIQQHGGLHPDARLQELVDRVGHDLVNRSAARDTDWQFDFHLLADPQTVNAFALPGGQVFITAALYDRFSTEGQLAGVLGHEIGHVIGRHSAARIAKQGLTQGLTGAVLVASDSYGTERAAQMVGQMVNMKYGREDELQSDQLGVLFMSQAGYDPRAMIEVMEILAAAGGEDRPPEFLSTHPNPENRIQRIQEAMDAVFPDGIPAGLTP